MLILERPILKEHSDWMADSITRRHAAGLSRPVGRSGVTNIIGHQNTTTYAILASDGTPVSWLYLRKKPSWCAYEVHQVYVLPELRGYGFAMRCYRAAINTDGLMIASGKTQSKASRALWYGFVERQRFNIWAQDFKNLELKAPVYADDGELECTLPIYTQYSTPFDVRLIAIAK